MPNEITHSRVGASSLYRWGKCPGSVRLCAKVPSYSSIYAEQGAAVHEMINRVLESETEVPRAINYVGWEASNGVTLESEDVEAGLVFIDLVGGLFRQGIETGNPFRLLSEVKFNIASIHEDLFGTSDAVLISEDLTRLKVIDYKHGVGVPVEVKNNPQLMYYALGAIQHVCDVYDLKFQEILSWGSVFKEVEIIVVQPRCRHKDGHIRSWIPPAEELNTFADSLRSLVLATQDPKAPLVAGDHCRFCNALSICPAITQKTTELAQSDFKAVCDPVNLNIPVPEDINPEELTKILRFAPVIKEWLEKVAAHVQRLLEHGEEVQGYKLVKKRSNRKWTDEKETLVILSHSLSIAEMMNLKSPAQIEKLLGNTGKAIVKTLVSSPYTGVTLAPEHDKRPAISDLKLLRADFSQLPQETP